MFVSDSPNAPHELFTKEYPIEDNFKSVRISNKSPLILQNVPIRAIKYIVSLMSICINNKKKGFDQLNQFCRESTMKSH